MMMTRSTARSGIATYVAAVVILVLVVVGGGLSYYAVSGMSSNPGGTSTNSLSSSSRGSTTITASSSSLGPTRTISSSSSTASSSTSSSNSSTTTSDGAFVLPKGGSEIIIPQGIQNADAQQLDITFSPVSITVVVGVNNTIFFVNQDLQDNLGHVIQSTSWPSSVPYGFSFDLVPGRVANVTLTVPGTYTYNCAWHPVWMIGTITVIG